MRKKIAVIFVMIFALGLFAACSTKDVASSGMSFGSESVLSFSDLVYTSDYVFTCYKPERYEIVEKGNGILEINGNVFDDRVYHKRYTFDIVDLIKSEQDIDELQIDEFFKDAFWENESRVDAMEEGVLYLALAYKTGDNYTMYFENALVALADDGEFLVQDAANPWKSVSDLEYTYEYEVAGLERLDIETMYRIKSEISSRYDADGKTNYKIFLPQSLENSGKEIGSAKSADSMEVVVYTKNAKTDKVTEEKMSVAVAAAAVK